MMEPVSDRRRQRALEAGWVFFCLVYYLPGLVRGGVVPSSPVWYFERQLQWIPFTNFVAHCVRDAGILPAWCPHFYSGFPFLAYPPNIFYSLSGWFMVFLGQARGNFLVNLLGFSIGGIFFLRGLRLLGLSLWASVFGLLLFVGGSYFNCAVSYEPWAMFEYLAALWAVAGIVRDAPRLKYLVVFFVSLGIGLGWDIEQEFYLITGLFLAAILFSVRPVSQRVCVLLLGLALALLFLPGPLLNLAAYGPHTVRAAGLSYDNYISGSTVISVRDFMLAMLFPFPGVLPPNLQANYLGWVTVLTAGIGLWSRKFRGLKAGVIIGIFLLYVIDSPVLMRLLFHIPVVNRMAMHYAAAIVPELGICLLAAFGVDHLLKVKSRLLAFALVVLMCALAVLSLKSEPLRSLGLFLASVAGGAALFKPSRGWLWPIFILLAAVFDVSYTSFRIQHRASSEIFADRPSLTEYLSKEQSLVRFWPLSVQGHRDTQVHPLVGLNLPLELPGTASPLGYWRMPLMRNAKMIELITPGYLKLDKEGRFDGLDISAPRDGGKIDEGDLFWLKLLNVGNMISRGMRLSVKGIEPNGESGDLYFYKIANPVPRYFLASKLRRCRDGAEAFAQVASRNFDPESTVLVEQEFGFESAQEPGKVWLKRYLPGEINFEVELPGSGGRSVASLPGYMLVVGESYVPGWRAFSSGHELRIFRADYVFMGLPLFAGSQKIRLVYFPYQARVGLWSSLASCFFWSGFVLFFAAGRRMKKTAQAL